jgi:transposase
MEMILERCCGLDVHQATVVACMLVNAGGRRTRKEVRTFRTVTRELVALRDWLLEEGVTHVAMESTGIYWVPVFQVLEGHVEMVLGNAQHIRNVPGRKTDVKDSEWIADLLRHGLIRPSFVPPAPIRELRALTRHRRQLSGDQTRERNRIMRLLETANIKLASVASDVFGVSGRTMLGLLLAGVTDPTELARVAKGRLRKKIPQLVEALDGHVTPHHRFILKLQLDHLEHIERQIVELDAAIDAKVAPYTDEIALLVQLPGVSRVLAAAILAELGPDMSVFPTARHAAAWAGTCPGNKQTGGKSRPTAARKGNVHLLTSLFQAATSAVRRRGTYLHAKFHKLRARRGAKRAYVAIANKLLIAAYHMLRDRISYRDLGAAHLASLRSTPKHVLVAQLEAQGYRVTLEPVPPRPAHPELAPT